MSGRGIMNIKQATQNARGVGRHLSMRREMHELLREFVGGKLDATEVHRMAGLPWDIILMVADAELSRGRPPAVKDIHLGLGVPKATVLRTLSRLEELGVIERRRDTVDSRRTFVGLMPAFRDRFVDRFVEAEESTGVDPRSHRGFGNDQSRRQ